MLARKSRGMRTKKKQQGPRSLTRSSFRRFFFSTSSAFAFLSRTNKLSLVLPLPPPPPPPKTVHRPHRRGGRGARRLRRVGRRPRRRRDRRRATRSLFPAGVGQRRARVGRVGRLGPVTSSGAAQGRMSRFSFSPHRHNPTFHDIQGFFLRAAFFFPRKTEWGGGRKRERVFFLLFA